MQIKQIIEANKAHQRYLTNLAKIHAEQNRLEALKRVRSAELKAKVNLQKIRAKVNAAVQKANANVRQAVIQANRIPK